MKLSYNWLSEHIDLPKNTNQLAQDLTNLGLEVEGQEQFTTLKGSLDKVVVGHVLEKWPHPDADKLNLTKVDIGDEVLQIVCGAPNVEEGQKVPVAKVGAKLNFNDGKELKIKKGKIRGQDSFGMICAEDELGLGESHEGILVLNPDLKPGTAMRDVVKVYEDTVYEIGLTPNRVDAACHLGAARDLSALFKSGLKNVSTTLPKQGNSKIKVNIKDIENCPRYAAAKLSNVQVKNSPEWLQNRLKAIGIQPKNNVVDITNFVMHDMGHPMHAFDCDAIAGEEIIVRKAIDDEKLTTLDSVERKLSSSDLIIADKNRPLALAGVLGGENSAVKENSTSICLESAFFNPTSIRRTAKRHQLSTDASFRFERGADPEGVLHAMAKAIELLKEHASAELDGGIEDQYPNKQERKTIDLKLEYLTKIAGYEIPSEQVLGILESLGFEILKQDTEKVEVLSAPFKPDVLRPVDLVEEIMRVIGFNQVPLKSSVNSSIPANNFNDSKRLKQKATAYLNAQGFHEIKSNPFSGGEIADAAVKVLNPLSQEMNQLRVSHIRSGLDAMAYNLNRQQESLRLFEIANDYSIHGDEYQEHHWLTLWLCGTFPKNENWHQKRRSADFHYINSYVVELLSMAGISSNNFKTKIEANDFAYCLVYLAGEKVVATVGQVSKKVCKEQEVEADVYAAQIDFKLLLKKFSRRKKTYTEISKFPKVSRDLSLIVDDKAKFEELAKQVNKLKGNLLKRFSCFDLYKGKNIDDNKLSLGLRFEFENDKKTLSDKQVDFQMKEIIKLLEEVGCEIRK